MVGSSGRFNPNASGGVIGSGGSEDSSSSPSIEKWAYSFIESTKFTNKEFRNARNYQNLYDL